MPSNPTSMIELGLFTGQPQYENFARLKDWFPASEMKPSTRAKSFPQGAPIELPKSYLVDGQARDLAALLDGTHTSALLVLKDGQIRFEKYWLTGGRDVHWISMSVAKSFVSALVGIALGEGLIGSIDDAIDRYVPSFGGSAYAGVSIKNVLQMSSGARWNEDYSDPNSEIFRLGMASMPGGSLDAFVPTLVNEAKPGTICRYNSAETQALGMLLVAATGRSISDYMQEKLCEPLGMESSSFWLVDGQGREMVYACLNMTARDFAKLGELYRNKGLWGDRRIVSADWVAASTKVAAPHLQAGRTIVGDHAFPLGYGYQWWLPPGDRGEFSAIGVYNQYVYVDPSRGVVAVKLSANPAYGTSTREEDNKDYENIEALRAIARRFD
ncbi:serine hydrolase [Bradyrhizobium sp. KB893862 SZCCT0404]|uniref:serine hydrolase domain-containing protein n=1 Tax=Bradyrhizobium sp. KB893862 SZCCT0404 TaxID=2807672 RepID=UPI001BA8CBDE|nr:serine hydrolase [Bradyrhizobium sp. KB893862 SZCCT0404]MBR1177137.1 serine hydrolase [Bradyrhizobium sp. KB893862 SZCCT0404]